MTIDEAALDKKLALLDEKIREANGTLKDIRDEKRATEKLIQDFQDRTESKLAAIMEAAVREALDTWSRQMETAIGESTQRVYDRFDLIANLCLGEDYDSEAEGKTPLTELVRRYIAKNGPVA